MAIENIGGVSTTTSVDSNNAINQEEFIKLFLAQLNFQDPLEPVDNREFLTQMAQFSQLQVAGEQSESLQNLVFLNSSDQGLTLLGKTVNYKANEEANSLSGTVSAVHYSGAGFTVDIKISETLTIPQVSISQITSVTNL